MPDTGKLVFWFLARLRGLLLIFHLAVCLVSKWKISICDGVVVKRCRRPGTAEAVISLVSKEFSGASVRAA
jgi:hypothetical protein